MTQCPVASGSILVGNTETRTACGCDRMHKPDELCAYSDMICAWILDAISMMCISCNGDSVITGCMVIRSTFRSTVSRNALTACMRASDGVMIVVVICLFCVVGLCVRQNDSHAPCPERKRHDSRTSPEPPDGYGWHQKSRAVRRPVVHVLNTPRTRRWITPGLCAWFVGRIRIGFHFWSGSLLFTF